MTLATLIMGLMASVVLYVAFRPQVESAGHSGAFALPALTEGQGKAWTIVLAVDFTSPKARQVFREVTKVVAEDWPGGLDVFLLHAPSGGCGPESEAGFACMSARALSCTDDRDPVAQLRLAGAAFDLQWEPAGARTYSTLRERARSFGIDVNSLDTCSRRPETFQRVEGQRKLVERFGYVDGVGGWMIYRRGAVVQAPFGQDTTAETLRWLGRCLKEPTECGGTR